MRNFFQQFRPFFLNAALFSFFINLALLTPSIYMLQIFDRVLTSRSGETLIMLTLIALLALMMMLALDYLRTLLLVHAGIALDRMLGGRVLSSLIERGSQIDRTEDIHGLRDVAVLRGFLGGNSIVALFDLPWMVFYIILIYLFHPLLGIVATLAGILLFFIAWANEKLNRKEVEKNQLVARKASHFIDQGMANVDAVNAMGMMRAIIGRWSALNEQVLTGTLHTTLKMGGINSLSRFVRQAIQVSMMGLGAYLVVNQHVSAGIMIATTIILGRALAPIESLIGNWNNFIQARLAFARLQPLMSSAEPPATLRLPEPQGRLQVEKAALAGRSPDRPIIRQVNFELLPGESLGVIGPSASGKSSLARLLIGVWRPTVGSVRLDGADIARIPREQIGPYLGYLPQDVELFPGSIADNIARMDKPDADKVIAAARMARVHDLILRLPNGYDTSIGPGGHILSGGQMQRIALARALYDTPRFVVLDEPNSNLDAEGEFALAAILEDLRVAGTTVILITHKPSVIQNVDKIIVLREGLQEMFGPRQEILARLRDNATRQQAGA